MADYIKVFLLSLKVTSSFHPLKSKPPANLHHHSAAAILKVSSDFGDVEPDFSSTFLSFSLPLLPAV